MYAVNDPGQRARWEVRWAVKKKGRIRWIVKPCGQDFSLALRVYELCKDAGKAGVTLRCCNIAFPPPDDFADPKYVIVTKRVKVKGRTTTKKYKKRDGIELPRRYDTLMHEQNLQGKWWCPYCIKFRRFVKQDRPGGAVMACPCCEAGHTLGTVARYNPQARSIGTMRSTRSDKGTRRALA